jgi:hypothetical protein
MNTQNERKRVGQEEPEIQQGEEKSIAKQERLKKLMHQHPQRDEPRIDGVGTEEEESLRSSALKDALRG